MRGWPGLDFSGPELLSGLLQKVQAVPPAPGEGGEPVQHAVPWQLWHSVPATPVMERLEDFHLMLLIIMVAICLFVVALLAYVLFRFHHTRNPVPSRTTHNTLIEVVWTVVPVIILVVIAVPSFKALYFMERIPEDAEMTLKITGRQWYWDYEYPDQGGIAFSSYIIPDEDLPEGGQRLLEVDQRAVVPAGVNIRIVVTGGDVIHAMAMPSLGIKRDAIPGRLNETWMRIERPGVYYGQCSEICGTGHGYMPLAIEAVSPEAFKQWVAQQQAALGIEPTQVAASTQQAGSEQPAPAQANSDQGE